MDINKIFLKIFGEHISDSFQKENPNENISQRISGAEQLPLSDSFCLQIARIKYWLNHKLIQIESECKELISMQKSRMGSRIGPDKVVFDIDFESTMKISKDRLSVRSQGSFNTTKTNVCVFGGKWMYEVQLQSKGVMQVGWCSNKCAFNENRGVGDTKYSYGYDGSKQQIWHISTTKYGDKWQSGDIIGVCIDVDHQTIEYFRNGTSLGVAFKSLDKGPGIALFAGASLGYNEGIRGNFGGSPFRFPVAGFHALQMKPFEKLQKADLLLGYMVNLAGILSRPKYRKEKRSKEGKFSNKKTIYTLICATLIEKLADVLLEPYVIEEKLLPYVMNLCVLRSDADKDTVILPGSLESTLGTLLSLFWNYFEDEEIKFVLKTVLNILISMYTQNSKSLEYERQRKVVVILNCICNHPETRKYYIEHKFFTKHCLPLLMYLPPPEYTLMTEILPDDLVWTEGIGGSKEAYLSACEKLSKSVETLYGLQKNFLKNLLVNNDGNALTSSSRKIFINQLRKYVMDSAIAQKPLQALFLLPSTNHNQLESPVALSFFCILTDITKHLFEEEMDSQDAAIDPKYFFDGTFRYQYIDRLGGVLSHLRKVHRNDVSSYLGSDHEATQNLEETQIVRSTSESVELDAAITIISANLNTLSILGRTQNNGSDRNQLEILSPGDMSFQRSLHELVDLVTLFYYALGHKHIVKIASVRDEISGLNEVLKETQYYRDDVETHLKALNDVAGSGFSAVNNEILLDMKEKFGQRENVFAKRSIELARKQSWYRSVALGAYRRGLLIWLLDKILLSLQKSSELGPLFAFVPEVYINILPILLDTILDFCFHDISEQFEVSDAQTVISKAAEFLGEHAGDPRIVLATCKDSLLQALGTLTCHESGMIALEKSPLKSQTNLINELLRPLENRAWGQSNWLLLRFWLGEGFAYRDARQPSIWLGGNEPLSLGLCRSRAKNETHTGLLHHIAPAYPSKYFQQFIGKILTEDEPFATLFLNSVLSQLNWAFSEFVLLLQEIQNTCNRQEGEVVFESKQLKICAMCFELTVSLMRCLEMVISVAPEIFQDPSRQNSDLILNRVCQLISQVLSRVTVPPGCFQYVVDMCLAELASVTHFAIITAVMGILWALMHDEILDDKKPVKISRVTRSLLTDPSFQLANLEYALGEVRTPITQPPEIPRGNFDPAIRGHVDSSTNDFRNSEQTSSAEKQIRSHPPVLRFKLSDYPTHITDTEIDNMRKIVETLRVTQTLLSDITLPSEDSLCPICCAKPITVAFNPCKHQSCSNCILQHLMNNKLCFYCKTLIRNVENFSGEHIYVNTDYDDIPHLTTDN